MSEYRKKVPGRGSIKGHGCTDHLRIVIAFPTETFDEIRTRAVKERTSFAEQVRLLVEWGLESA